MRIPVKCMLNSPAVCLSALHPNTSIAFCKCRWMTSPYCMQWRSGQKSEPEAGDHWFDSLLSRRRCKPAASGSTVTIQLFAWERTGEKSRVETELSWSCMVGRWFWAHAGFVSNLLLLSGLLKQSSRKEPIQPPPPTPNPERNTAASWRQKPGLVAGGSQQQFAALCWISVLSCAVNHACFIPTEEGLPA